MAYQIMILKERLKKLRREKDQLKSRVQYLERKLKQNKFAITPEKKEEDFALGWVSFWNDNPELRKHFFSCEEE